MLSEPKTSKLLNYHNVNVGTFFSAPDREGRELNFSPQHPLNTVTEEFNWLKRKLHETGYHFVIEDNGQVRVTIPRGHKYGYILGWVAWTYRQNNMKKEKGLA